MAEWNRGLSKNKNLALASAAKSIFSSVLGIIQSVFDIPDRFGTKPVLFAFKKEHAITPRHLITNTSGYMKPGEQLGKIFHYQTFGMIGLTHAIAKTYGLYDIRDLQGSPGLKGLIDQTLGKPISATWDDYSFNFALPKEAKINIFG